MRSLSLLLRDSDTGKQLLSQVLKHQNRSNSFRDASTSRMSNACNCCWTEQGGEAELRKDAEWLTGPVSKLPFEWQDHHGDSGRHSMPQPYSWKQEATINEQGRNALGGDSYNRVTQVNRQVGQFLPPNYSECLALLDAVPSTILLNKALCVLHWDCCSQSRSLKGFF